LRAPLVNLKGFAGELALAIDVIESGMAVAMPHLEAGQRDLLRIAIEEDVPEALQFIVSSVDRMEGFIAALLKLSRIGHRALEPERLNMRELALDTVATLEHQIQERSARVIVEDLPEIVADDVSMRQVWANLLTNAVIYLDATRPGEIVVSGMRSFNATTFSVKDNGRGIVSDDMEKVFAPFRRAGASDIPGEGMGLAYVQAVIQRHGGHIGCESTPGLGSTFTFTIPDHKLEPNCNE